MEKSPGLIIRATAFLIDVFVYSLITAPLGVFVFSLAAWIGVPIPLTLWDALILVVTPPLLTLYLWHRFSATPGKLALGMAIVDAKTGGKPSNKQLVIRLFAYLLSLAPFGLGFLWAVFRKDRRTWHDMLSSTKVLRHT